MGLRAVNLNKESCRIYCGRPSSFRNIGENLSCLGNPFPMVPFGKNKRSREESINEYKKWLWQKMSQKDSSQRAALQRIIEIEKKSEEEITLGCFCAPKNCHVNVIIKAIEWLKNSTNQKKQ